MRVGITGGIATGKSTVSKMMQKCGFPLIDADKIAREIVLPDNIGWQRIVAHFGTSILNHDQTINRNKLGDLIFADEKKREILNQITHPIIEEEMLKKAKEYEKTDQSKIIIFDIPLLFEARMEHLVDKIIVVYLSEELQIARLRERNSYSFEEASKRVQSQLPIEQKLMLADFVIDNSGSIQATAQQVHEICNKLLKEEKK